MWAAKPLSSESLVHALTVSETIAEKERYCSFCKSIVDFEFLTTIGDVVVSMTTYLRS